MTYNAIASCEAMSSPVVRYMSGYNSLQKVDWNIVWCHICSEETHHVWRWILTCQTGTISAWLHFTPWLSFKTIRENVSGSETDGALGGRAFTGCKSMAIYFWIRPWHISVCNSVWRSLGHLCSYCRVSAIMRPGGSGNRMSRWMNHCICLALFSVYMPKVLHV